MAKYEHNQICTTNNEIIVGNEYDYKEEGYECRVKVLEDNSDREGIGFLLKIVPHDRNHNFYENNQTFNVWAAAGKYAYNGMWRLYNVVEYLV
jgi:hypothetical protein